MSRKLLFTTFLFLLLAGTSIVFFINKQPASQNPVETVTKGNMSSKSAQQAIGAVKSYAAKQLNISEEEISVTKAVEKEFSDGCLGIAERDQMCTQVITPGYEITVQGKNQEFVYRTTRDGSLIKQLLKK